MQGPIDQSIDVCLIALHGGDGENGTIQGLCELFHIPYTGMRRTGATVAMNKWLTKKIFKINGVSTFYLDIIWSGKAPGKFYSVSDLKALIYNSLSVLNRVLWVAVLGLHFADDVRELQALLSLDLFEQDDAVLIEPAVQSLKEFNVSVIRNSNGVDPFCN